MGTGMPAGAQEGSPRMLSVVGHGQAEAATTLAQISLTISDKGNSAQDTYDQLEKRSSAVVKRLQSANVESLKTSNISLNIGSSRDGKPQKDDYDGYQTIAFRVSTSGIGVLDDAIAANIDRINSIQYVAPETAMTAARKIALEKAIADAQAQAEVALDKLGFSVQEIVDVRINDAQIQAAKNNPAPQDDSYSSSWSNNLPVLALGEQTVDVQVTLEIRY